MIKTLLGISLFVGYAGFCGYIQKVYPSEWGILLIIGLVGISSISMDLVFSDLKAGGEDE